MNLTKKSSSFNLSKYSIQFSCVFEFNDIKESFYKFLKTEFNTEPLDCVLEIDKIKTLKTDKEKIKKCNEIIEDYVKTTGKKEINISGETKLKLFQDFGAQLEQEEIWNLQQTPTEIFAPIKKILLTELRADNWPRFVRTKDFHEIIMHYVDNPKVMVLNSLSKYPFKDEHFEKPYVTKQEMLFMNDVVQDSFNWDSIYSKNHFNVYSSSIKFIPDSNFFKSSNAVRFEYVIPYSFEQSIVFFLSIKHLLEIEPEIIDISIREKIYSKELKTDEIENPFYFLIGDTSQMSHFPLNTPRKSTDVFNIDFDVEEEKLTFCKRPYIGDFKGKNVDFDKKLKFDFVDKKKQTKEVLGFFVNQFLICNLEVVDPYTTKIALSMSNQH